MKKVKFILSAVALVWAIGGVIASKMSPTVNAYDTTIGALGPQCVQIGQCNAGEGSCTISGVPGNTVSGGTGGHCGVQLKAIM